MPTRTDIESKILQLGPGEFQELCDVYLARVGYEKISSYGKQKGVMKTTIGNPDTYFFNPITKKYKCAVFTTTSRNDYEKIKEDIEKCFDSSMTGVEISSVEEIIACHTSSRLSPGQHKALIDLCKEKEIDCTIIGINQLAMDIYQKYPILSRDYLNLPLDTSQIFTLQDFIINNDKNQLAAPYNTQFQFREEEVKKIQDLLVKAKILILYGKAGCGKTRLALEACRVFSEKNGYNLFCFKSNYLPIHEDINYYIQNKGNYILFVDDANEFNLSLDQILKYLVHSEDADFRIVLTVRDYTSKRIIEQVAKYAHPELVPVPALSDDQIKTFIKKNLSIANEIYLGQIVRIAEGNPRIAYIAGKTAREQNLASIRNVSQLFGRYYIEALSSLMIDSDRKQKTAAAIVSFLGKVDMNNTEILEPLLSETGLGFDDFKIIVQKLHELEFLNIYYNRVITVSDQCFSNYVLYWTLIEQRIISLDFLVEYGFNKHRYQLVDALSMLLNIFNSEDLENQIRRIVELLWQRCLQEGDESRIFEFIKTFALVIPSETLSFIHNKIKALDTIQNCEDKFDCKTVANTPVKDQILSAVKIFSNNLDILDTVMDLSISYLKKNPNVVCEFAALCISDYGVDEHSYINDYATPNKVASRLYELANDIPLKYSKLFIAVARKQLSLSIHLVRSARKRTITVSDMALPDTVGVRGFRQIYWDGLLSICQFHELQPDILDLLDVYATGWDRDSDFSSLLQFDSKFVIEIFRKLQPQYLYKVAYICSRLFLKYEHYGVLGRLKQDFSFCFSFEDWEIFSLLTSWELRGAQNAEMERKLVDYIQLLPPENYCSIFVTCNEILKELPERASEINRRISIFFSGLKDSKEKLIKLTHSFLHLPDNKLDILPDCIIKSLLDNFQIGEVFTSIEECTCPRIADNWRYAFFELFPDSEVSYKWLEAFLQFLAERNGQALLNIRSFQFKSLCNKYSGILPDIHLKLIEVIMSAGISAQRVYLHTLFYYYQPEELIVLFRDDAELLVNIYLSSIEYDSSADYDGEFLKLFVDRIPGFLRIYTSFLKGKEDRLDTSDANRTLSLWKCDECFELFDYLISGIMDVSDPYASYSYKNFVSALLSKPSDFPDLAMRQEQWVLRFIESISNSSQHIRYFFRLLDDISFELRRKCIFHFITVNQDFECFKVITLLPSIYGGMGPLSSALEVRIEFLRSLLPNLTGLKFLNHKLYTEKLIEYEERNKEVELIEEVMLDIF